jgi:hypothetical protein
MKNQSGAILRPGPLRLVLNWLTTFMSYRQILQFCLPVSNPFEPISKNHDL